MDKAKNYSLLLLAGGKSSRMGRDKAVLMLEGKTFIEHLVSAAKQLGIEKMFLSGHSWGDSGIHTVLDEYPERGPLGGLHACMKAMDTPYCLVLPVDVPKISVKLLSALLSHHESTAGEKPLVWRHGDRIEPLIGVYPTAMAAFIEERIRSGPAPVLRILDDWGYECFDMESDTELININTPESYEKLKNMGEKTTIDIRRIRFDGVFPDRDEAALEKNLTISLKNGESIHVTCTPSYEAELIIGRRYLLSDLTEGEYPPQPEEVLEHVEINALLQTAQEIYENPGELFQTTGCAHSCALVKDGKVLCHMEDIGRHNALDKVVGYALMNGISIKGSIVFTSGRISEDYLQKVIAAGFGIVVSRAAVTVSAAELAKEKNVTVLGFVRKFSGNIYNEGKVALN